MRIHLVDDHPLVVEAWQRHIAPTPGLAILQADILTVARGALVSPANSSGHMDGGIDAHYLAFFGHALQERVYRAIEARAEGHLPVGAAAVVPTGHPIITHLIVAPTMDFPGEVDASHCYRAFRAALRVAERHGDVLDDVFCPGLATGVGCVEPDDMAREMARALRDHATRRPPPPPG